jgi:4-amino-4-deoxy-L-arabinose transferase-like glycosyltransferase
MSMAATTSGLGKIDNGQGDWKGAAVVFGLAAAVRWAFVFAVAVKPIAGGDPGVYKETAHNIRTEGVYYSSEGRAFRPPLYPYFVAGVYLAVGEADRSLFLVQAVIGALSAVLLYCCLRRWDTTAAVVGAALFTIHPLMLFYEEQALTESLYIFLLLLATWLALRALDGGTGWSAACGVVLGLAIMCRSEAVVAAALFLTGLTLFMRGEFKRRLARVALTAAAAAAIIVPWVARNYFVVGAASLSTEGGATLYLGNNPDATGGYHVPAQMFKGVPATEAERDRYFKNLAVDYLIKNPSAWGRLLIAKQRNLWGPHNNKLLDTADFVLVPFVLCGLILAGWQKKRWYLSFFLAAPFLSMLIISSLFIGQVRFRTSSYPFFLAMCSFFIAAITSQVMCFYRPKMLPESTPRPANPPSTTLPHRYIRS